MNEQDKKELAKLVAKELKGTNLQYVGMSKSEIAKAEKKKELTERQAYLQIQKQYNRDTLAQRIELEKLKFQQTGAGKISGVTGKILGETGKFVGGVGSAVANSKLGKGLADALLYSNPITALIAQNMDLFKGVGNIGLQGLKLGGKAAFGIASGLYKLSRRPKAFPKSSSSSENLLTSKKADNNYILTKSAMFVGGKNYLMLGTGLGNGIGGGAFSALSGRQDLLEDRIGAPRLLTDKNSTAGVMKKGLEGINDKIKKSNKFLESLNKKNMLILGAILLGVAGITALAMFIANKLPKRNQQTPNVSSIAQANAFKDQSNQTLSDIQTKLNNATKNASHISSMDSFRKAIPLKDGTSQEILHTTSGMQAQSKEGDPYPSPYDIKVLDIIENVKKLGVVNIIAERTDNIKRNNIEIMNVVNPLVIPYDNDNTKNKKFSCAKRGEIIGFVGPGGKIQIKDISNKDFKNYIADINKATESGDYTSRMPEITQERVDALNKQMSQLANTKEVLGSSTAGVKNAAYAQQQKEFSETNNKLATEALRRAIDNDYNGTYINGRFIPKSELQNELNKYNANVTNAVENAKSNQTSPNNKPKKQPKAEGITTGGSAPIGSIDTGSNIMYKVPDPQSQQVQSINEVVAR